jgi:RimJ/RimL family protein N-acetyltransferase
MASQLFEGKLIRFAPHDPDRDAEIDSKWSHDPDYLRSISLDPARPLSPPQIKKKYEDLVKEANEERDLFSFAIRTKADDRLIGFARLFGVEWTHAVSRILIGIGDPNDRGHGYGREAMQMLLRYAFDELNLYRITATTFEYNTTAIAFLKRNGFVLEVTRREAVQRDGRYWDFLAFGLLRDEWVQAK